MAALRQFGRDVAQRPAPTVTLQAIQPPGFDRLGHIADFSETAYRSPYHFS
jgi:hypothetical protein